MYVILFMLDYAAVRPDSDSDTDMSGYRQGWVSSGRNLFLPGHPEKSGRNLFLPILSRQNWKKLDKTGKKIWKRSEILEKIIIILTWLLTKDYYYYGYKCIWLIGTV